MPTNPTGQPTRQPTTRPSTAAPTQPTPMPSPSPTSTPPLTIILSAVLPFLAILLCTASFYAYRRMYPPPKVFATRGLLIGGKTRDELKNEWGNSLGLRVMGRGDLDSSDADDETEDDDDGEGEQAVHHQALDFMSHVISAALTDVSQAEAQATILVRGALSQALLDLSAARGLDADGAHAALQSALGGLARTSAKLLRVEEGVEHAKALSMVALFVEEAVADLNAKRLEEQERKAAAHASALWLTSSVLRTALADLSREHEEHAATKLVSELLHSALAALGAAQSLQPSDAEAHSSAALDALEHTLSCLGSEDQVSALVDRGVMLAAHAEALAVVRGVVLTAMQDLQPRAAREEKEEKEEEKEKDEEEEDASRFIAHTTLSEVAAKGASVLQVESTANFTAGMRVEIGAGPDMRPGRLLSVGGGKMQLARPLRSEHGEGARVAGLRHDAHGEAGAGPRAAAKAAAAATTATTAAAAAEARLPADPAVKRMSMLIEPTSPEELAVANTRLANVLGEAALEEELERSKREAHSRLEVRRGLAEAPPRQSDRSSSSHAPAADNASGAPALARAGHPRLPQGQARPDNHAAHAAAASLLMQEASESLHLSQDLESAHVRAHSLLQAKLKARAPGGPEGEGSARPRGSEGQETSEGQRQREREREREAPGPGPRGAELEAAASVGVPPRLPPLQRGPSFAAALDAALPPSLSPRPPPRLSSKAPPPGPPPSALSRAASQRLYDGPDSAVIDVHPEHEQHEQEHTPATPPPYRPQLVRQPSRIAPPPTSPPPAHLVRAYSVAALRPEALAAPYITLPIDSAPSPSPPRRPPPLTRQPSRIIPPPSSRPPAFGPDVDYIDTPQPAPQAAREPDVALDPRDDRDDWHADSTPEQAEDWFRHHRAASRRNLRLE